MDKIKKLLQAKQREKTYVEKTPEDVYREVASKVEGLSKEDVAKFGGIESQHGKYEGNMAGSSATGIFQFMPKTAKYLIPGSERDLRDRNNQAELMTEYLNRNNQNNIEDAYLFHHLGPTRAKKFIKADDKLELNAVIPDHVIKANPSIYKYKTVGEAKNAIKERLNVAGENFTFSEDENTFLNNLLGEDDA